MGKGFFALGSLISLVAVLTLSTGEVRATDEEKHWAWGDTFWEMSVDELKAAMPKAHQTRIVSGQNDQGYEWMGMGTIINECKYKVLFTIKDKKLVHVELEAKQKVESTNGSICLQSTLDSLKAKYGDAVHIPNRDKKVFLADWSIISIGINEDKKVIIHYEPRKSSPRSQF